MKRFLIAFAVAALAALPASAQESGNEADSSGLTASLNSSIPATASATCCHRYYDHSHANGNARTIMRNFNQKISAMQLAIIEAMRLQTGQLSGNLREQTGAGHTLADQQDDRATVKAVEEARLQAIRDAESSAGACRIITGSRGGAGLAQRNEFSNELADSIGKWVRGEEGPSSEGQASALLARVEVHCARFGTQADVDAGICRSVGSLPGADVDAALSISYKEGGVSSTYSPERLEAAKGYLVNTVGAYPYAPIDQTMSQTIEGREEMARRQTHMAYSSQATKVLSDYVAERTGSRDSSIVGWARATAGGMNGYQNATYSNGLSHHDWLELAARSFWLSDVVLKGETNPVAAIKEMKNMGAVSLYLQWEGIKHLEQISLTLAHILDIQNLNARTDVATGG